MYIVCRTPYVHYMVVAVVQSLTGVQLFVTPWTAAHHASLSFTISQILLKLMSIESVMPSNHLMSPPSLSLSQHRGFFQWVSSLHQVTKVSELQLQHESFQRIFRVDFLEDWLVWLSCCSKDSQEFFPALQLKSISTWCSAFFMVQLSYPYMTTGKTIALARRTFVNKVMPLLFIGLS